MKRMKFNLSNFLELDTKALLAVNGGSDCGGGYSPPSNPSAGGGSKTPTGGGGSGSGSGRGASGGGYCSGASDGKTIYANPYYKDGGKNSTSTSTGGGNCGNISGKNDLPAIPNTAEEKADPAYANQRDFSSIYGDDFGNEACAATSLLNEISEQYTAETGKALTQEQINSAMAAAVASGNIDSTKAYVNSWEGAANDMASAVGLEGSFTYTYNPSEATATIYAVDSNGNGDFNHFVNGIGNGQYYDPWSGQTGNISDLDLAKTGLGNTRDLIYTQR